MATVDLPRPSVPASVAVVRDFVNTTDHETGSDDLATPAELAAYLHREGLTLGRGLASASELELAHGLRAGLRDALEEREGFDTEPAGLAAALEELDVRLTYDATGPVLTTSASGIAGGLARIGLAAHAMAVEGLWGRLKICASDECGWAYFDHSKNRSRSWCEYGCGNKVKTRSYRARRRSARAAEGAD
jgi:predicted RNA-binding Zn ribbon-like protein